MDKNNPSSVSDVSGATGQSVASGGMPADVEARLERLLQENAALRSELARAQAEAKAAAQVKSEFMARMSHEIRTPMNAVIGLATLALRTELTEKQQHYLQKIRDSAQTLLGIFSDLLDFTRIENQTLALAPQPFHLKALMEGLGQDYGPKAGNKDLVFAVFIDEHVPVHLIGDRQRLAQALGLLVDNAVKFTHAGRIDIAASLVERDRRRARVRFSVADTGIGLDRRQQHDLFALFTQADTSFARSYGGMGIGLALCRRLVEMMGGEIAVESEQGKGSTFFFTLEFARAANESFSRAQFVDKRILVVVANPALRTMYLDYFKGMPCHCQSAATCAEAEEAITRAGADAPFHAVVLDDALPDGSGLECAHGLANQAHAPFPPRVVLLSASDAVKTDPNASGFVVLSRPATQPAVLGAMNIALGQAGTGPAEDEAAVSSKLAGKRVLLVEDNPINQEVASEMLQGWGIDVAVARDGAIALTMAEQAPYDAVLMDVQMPGMDGLEATRRLRTLACCQHLPIIALTAHALDEDRQRCLDAGMDDYLSKPVDPDLLYIVLLRWIAPGIALADEDTAAPEALQAGQELPEARTTGPGLAEDILERPSAVGETAAAPGVPAAVGESNRSGDGTAFVFGVGAPSPVLNLAAALQYLGGDTALLDDMLHDFSGHCPAITDRLFRALGKGDRITAQRLARTLKGLGGLFGVTGLVRTAQELESWLEKATPDEASPQEVAHAANRESGYMNRLLGEVNLAVNAAREVLANSSGDRSGGATCQPGKHGVTRRPGAVPATEPDLPLLLSRIPGLDVASALNMLGGNRKLLRKICREFGKNYTQAGQELRAQLAVGDIDDARRMAHTVKGVAGNLGARQLAETAWALETSLVQQRNASDGLINDFEVALSEALNGTRLLLYYEQEPAPCAEPVSLPPLKVLFVDDARLNQTVFSEMLSERGFLVETAGNGKEACLRLFASEDDVRPFDLILMDLEMPEMDGFKTAQTIRKVLAASSRPTMCLEVPIIALTAHDPAQELERCLAAGMDDCVQKTFDPAVLLAAIERAYRARILPRVSRGVALKAARQPQLQSDSGESVDRERLVRVLGDLSAMLRRSNIAAEDQLQKLKALLTDPRWQTALRRIEQYVDQFDFQAANACVLAFARELGITLEG